MLFPILLIICVICYFDTRKPFFLQTRVGRLKQPFIIIKFRTMPLETPNVASHLLSSQDITKIGSFLRHTKLDELPQLWNVILGQMSLVGPRPCLYSQTELIRQRENMGVFLVKPGITGLAQLRGIDMSDPIKLAHADAYMINNFSLLIYLKYIWMSIFGYGSGDRTNKTTN
jgi:O-antigen biosynthesis protein WbqP